jgi:hypothetical protein
LINKDGHTAIIKSKDIEVTLYRAHHIAEINFYIHKSVEYQGEIETSCEFEIGCGIDGSYAFKYPYDLRDLASAEFDKLVSFLKPFMMKSPSNPNKV